MDVNNKIQISEFVGCAHPDKMADIIADKLLTEANKNYGYMRMGLEVAVTDRFVCVFGEYTAENPLNSRDFTQIIKEFVGRFYKPHIVSKFNIHLVIKEQSKNIKNVVDRWLIPDQGVTYGYAEDSNPQFLPYSHFVGQSLNRDISLCVSTMVDLSHDYKLLVECVEGIVYKVNISIGHTKNIVINKIASLLRDVIKSSFEKNQIKYSDNLIIDINKGGNFFVTSLEADSGLTNRKLMVDNYGCNIEHGGGGYSGKDMSKPDRLFGYYARYIAKNVVASGLSKWCKTRIIYTYGSDQIDRIDVCGDAIDVRKLRLINDVFTKSYKEIYKKMTSKNIAYDQLAQYGHFGNNNNPWEMMDMANVLEEENTKLIAIF